MGSRYTPSLRFQEKCSTSDTVTPERIFRPFQHRPDPVSPGCLNGTRPSGYLQSNAALDIHPLTPPYQHTPDEHEGPPLKRRRIETNRIDDVFADIEQEIGDATILFHNIQDHQDLSPSIVVDGSWLENDRQDLEECVPQCGKDGTGGTNNDYEDQALDSILAFSKYDDIGVAAEGYGNFEDIESPNDEVCFGMVSVSFPYSVCIC